MDNTISDALSSVSTQLSAVINPGVVGAIVGLVLAAVAGIFLTWFGIRKIVSAVRNALKGRLSI